MTTDPAPVRCTGFTAKGAACRSWSVEGADLCNIHLRGARGRPSKLTPEIAERIIRHVQAGAYAEVAAIAAGISRRTLYRWLNRGRSEAPEDAGYAFFRERLEQAEAEGEVLLSTRLLRAIADGPQYAQWLLERRHPDRWARPSQRSTEDVPVAPGGEYDPYAEIDELAEARARRGS